MKELSIEEKAKRYDEAIERAKNTIEVNQTIPDIVECVESLFPELKESEDERIRKAIVWCIDTVVGELGVKEPEGMSVSKLKSWLEKQDPKKHEEELERAYKCADEVQYRKGYEYAKRKFEKQGEQKPNPCENCGIATNNCQKFPCVIRDGEQKPTDKVEPKFKIGDTIRNKITNEVFTIINRCISLEYYYDINHLHEVKFSEQDNWELVEQKPADKVERKFKVGDWIVNQHGTVRHIKEVDNAGYQTDKGWLTHENYEKNFHLWTIQDAKDGDVLYINNTMSESIMIYKSFNNGVINKYASYNKFGFEGENYLTLNDDYVCPATKEQRDILFAKMKEAGYEWDAKKKELKKIEQNLVDEIALGDALWCCKQAASIAKDENDMGNVWYAETWLKSLKDRVQTKQEWSEEDEELRQFLIRDLEMQDPLPTSIRSDSIKWLKSLKPQNRWKPSDEQMDMLAKVCSTLHLTSGENEIMESIYDALKKLKE